MPKRERPATTSCGEYWLRQLINQQTGLLDVKLNRVFGWGGDAIHWVSPLAKDSYAEYYDKSFLEKLGLPILLREIG